MKTNFAFMTNECRMVIKFGYEKFEYKFFNAKGSFNK